MVPRVVLFIPWNQTHRLFKPLHQLQFLAGQVTSCPDHSGVCHGSSCSVRIHCEVFMREHSGCLLSNMLYQLGFKNGSTGAAATRSNNPSKHRVTSISCATVHSPGRDEEAYRAHPVECCCRLSAFYRLRNLQLDFISSVSVGEYDGV
ncbi:hypothetical protein Y1Q_0014167 [Alligator mississippiensis]|uniref:Uncharacterized protein n=1 Tax=Alligator mississippiensis TaxID=8496 RepID=A0A151MTW2_ALLMI|nr:hypothetical protein Y1Q_0014167 [Alligator mississippiensis]